MTESCELYVGMAEDCVRGGNLAGAADHYSRALRFDERSLPALCGLCDVHLRAGDVEEARRVLGRALELGPAHPQVLKLQGELHARSGRFDLAVRSIVQATEAHLDKAGRRHYGNGRPPR